MGEPRDGIDEHGGDHGADERGGGQRVGRAGKGGEHDRRGDARAGGDTDDARIGERIPRDALEEGARDGKVAAGHGGAQGAGEPGVEHDAPRRLRALALENQGQLGDRDRRRTEREREHQPDDEDARHAQHTDPEPCPAEPRGEARTPVGRARRVTA